MIRRIALAGAAGAIALGGLAALGVGSAGAAPVIIHTATSANISCTLTSTAKLNPPLKNNWKKADHTGDAEAAVKNLPDTKFNTDGDQSVTSNAKTTTCTGSVSDASATATVSSLKISLSPNTQGVDNPPLQEDNTCAGLLAGTQPEDTAATYKSLITIKTVPGGAKVDPTNITGATIATSGAGFAIAGGTMTGSLAGGSGKTQAYITQPTLDAVAAPVATSSAPTPNPTCQANLKLKTKKGVTTASLKGPKGLKKIPIGANLLAPHDASNICLRKGSTCP